MSFIITKESMVMVMNSAYYFTAHLAIDILGEYPPLKGVRGMIGKDDAPFQNFGFELPSSAGHPPALYVRFPPSKGDGIVLILHSTTKLVTWQIKYAIRNTKYY